MDYKKIFIKEACPTSIGGQAIMEGVMMRGADRTAIAMRLPGDEIYLRTKKLKPAGKLRKIPILRGVLSFVDSLVTGMGTLMESADILEENFPEEDWGEPSALEQKINNRFGEKAAWNAMLFLSVLFAVVLSIGIFVIFPTIAINWLGKWVSNSIVLNLCEGFFRIVLFILYIYLISRMKDIQTLFQYHGSEHKTIHCFENGLELTVENVRIQPRHHPRCGTSFMFVVIVISIFLSIVIFTPLKIENTFLRMALHLLLLPLIVGVTYEFNRYVGGHDGPVCRALRAPGMWLQNFTTFEPDDSMIEVGIEALKQVLPKEKGADRW